MTPTSAGRRPPAACWGPTRPPLPSRSSGRLGAEVLVRPSPWRLGAAQADLAAEWLAGWVGAAGEQEVELAAELGPYVERRLTQARTGRLHVTVGHTDLLVLP